MREDFETLYNQSLNSKSLLSESTDSHGSLLSQPARGELLPERDSVSAFARTKHVSRGRNMGNVPLFSLNPPPRSALLDDRQIPTQFIPLNDIS